MANANITTIRKGQAIRYNNEVCMVDEMLHKTPPNNRAYVQIAIRSIAHGKVSHLRMTPNDSVDVVPITRDEYEFSYVDTEGYHFMNNATYEDVVVGKAIIDPIKHYLVENKKYVLLLTDDVVAAVELPASIELTVTEASEGVRGDSANNVMKTVRMETGLEVQAPLFIKPGEKLRINTEDGKYLGRA